jgi:hypothetical protein|tara:strand:- start:12 stop:233 length:222 start_codon:yes stop_codon:yes gene_type:complete
MKGKKMIDEIAEHFKTANKIVERAQRGLPHDRWMIGNSEMEAFVKAYTDLFDACNEMNKELIRKGFESMSTEK